MESLCSFENVKKRMADTGLASASSDAGDNQELIERKIEQVHREGGECETALLNKIADAIAPYDTYNDMEPLEILETLSDDSRTRLQPCAEAFTIFAMLEEGEARMRFKYEDAGKTIQELRNYWSDKAMEQLNSNWRHVRFDLDGDGNLTSFEKALNVGTLSSVRVSA